MQVKCWGDQGVCVSEHSLLQLSPEMAHCKAGQFRLSRITGQGDAAIAARRDKSHDLVPQCHPWEPPMTCNSALDFCFG